MAIFMISFINMIIYEEAYLLKLYITHRLRINALDLCLFILVNYRPSVNYEKKLLRRVQVETRRIAFPGHSQFKFMNHLLSMLVQGVERVKKIIKVKFKFELFEVKSFVE